jgi:chemotaxis regulatin CheY-phosphate phosphatase CheZ
MIEKVQKAIESGEATQDEIMMAMDIMQYQDIHRQKIERVINIMRALIKYMNRLFEGKIDDTKRVKSATHIHGDENEDVVDENDIEALIAQFGGGN